LATRKTALLVLSLALSLASLVWVLSGSELRELPGEIRSLHWGWVAVAVIADILVYCIQGWRWSLLLTPIAEVPVMKSIRAIYVGLFANEIIPFRAGEAIRCYLQARWTKLPFSVIAASAIIERIFDGIWLVIGLVAVVRLVRDLPASFVRGGSVLAIVVLLGSAILFIAMLQKNWALRNLSNRGWQRHLRILIEDLNLIGFSRYLVYSALMSLPYLLMQAVVIWAMLHAYALEDTSPSIAIVLMVLLRLSSAVPQAPGNLGAFQAVAAIALTMFGYDSALAKRFSLVLWGVVTLPLLITGFLALAVTGARLSELRKQAEASQQPTTIS
jgi:glycosyltransferase 2 family protein